MTRQLAYLFFTQANFCQRTQYAQLAPSLAARPELTGIVSIEAVQNHFKSAFSSDACERRIYMRLAKVAAVNRIRGVFRIVNFLRLDSDATQTDLTRQR